MQVPSWVAAWEVDVKLHEKVQTLHEAHPLVDSVS